MLSEREKAARCALFDSYCHTILRNAIRDYNNVHARGRREPQDNIRVCRACYRQFHDEPVRARARTE